MTAPGLWTASFNPTVKKYEKIPEKSKHGKCSQVLFRWNWSRRSWHTSYLFLPKWTTGCTREQENVFKSHLVFWFPGQESSPFMSFSLIDCYEINFWPVSVASWWFQPVKIKNIWNHHLGWRFLLPHFHPAGKSSSTSPLPTFLFPASWCPIPPVNSQKCQVDKL